MARAWRTASLIAAEHKMHPEADGALSERFYVSLWDTPIGEVFDWTLDPDGCEPLATFVHRAAQSVMRILQDDTPKGETVIVAHGGILLVVCALTNATLETSHRRNAVPLRFHRENGRWTATPV
jgi:broad specificity phosphatase PhoE